MKKAAFVLCLVAALYLAYCLSLTPDPNDLSGPHLPCDKEMSIDGPTWVVCGEVRHQDLPDVGYAASALLHPVTRAAVGLGARIDDSWTPTDTLGCYAIAVPDQGVCTVSTAIDGGSIIGSVSVQAERLEAAGARSDLECNGDLIFPRAFRLEGAVPDGAVNGGCVGLIAALPPEDGGPRFMRRERPRSDGHFRFGRVAPGAYFVSYEADGCSRDLQAQSYFPNSSSMDDAAIVYIGVSDVKLTTWSTGRASQ